MSPKVQSSPGSSGEPPAQLSGLLSYDTLVFDCDGVILNSNRIKTEAFRTAALAYGDAAAEALVAHHQAHGGVSRYAKFEHFLSEIVPADQSGPDLPALLESYASEVRAGLMTCEVADGLVRLREATSRACWMVVSGGDQRELRHIFAERGLDWLFDGGIFGSPASKFSILESVQATGSLRLPALFLGDSRYDHEAAQAFGMDFLFLHEWTEFSGWKAYVEQHGIVHLDKIGTLAESAG